MNPRFRFGRWLVLLILGAVLVVASAFRILKAQQKPNSNFTGGVVTRLDEKPEGNIAHFRFEPGSRTKWHSHAGGQIILVEEGVGLYQNRGGPVMELRAGETVYCPPGVEHWHGAAPHQGGVQYNISRGGITWLEEVTDKDFNTPPQHK
ncbi:MAG: cupin domain-containing protein [Acidobacteriia bacterium]|nr:cupin domain-containing protein [Terriglobia bacterium]